MNEAIKLKDFELCDTRKEHISRFVTKLQEAAPNDAEIKGVFQQKNHSVEGNIRLATKTGIFYARGTAENIFALSAKLQVKILRQLNKWRKSHFTKHKRRKYRKPILSSDI